MAKRPQGVQIGHVHFEIKWIPNKDWPKKDADDGGLMYGHSGQIHVRVAKGVHEQNLREVLLHEIGHAIWFVTQLTAENPRTWEDAEEHVIRYTTPTLLMVLRDNEDVLEYLTNA